MSPFSQCSGCSRRTDGRTDGIGLANGDTIYELIKSASAAKKSADETIVACKNEERYSISRFIFDNFSEA